mmetsp:Transcript_40156/g.75304  ORF Transcript_40156/g.75304 Transcript_40156/m.75304 type:complete len:366 (-) Transcript_40156:82-1179(-)
MTWLPANLASCTANWPVPPAAAVTSTVSPPRMRPLCSKAMEAVRPLVSSATVSLLTAGTGTTFLNSSTAYSEKPPYDMVATGLPTATPSFCAACAPTAATTPTLSNPTSNGNKSCAPGPWYRPEVKLMSEALTPVSARRIRTCPGARLAVRDTPSTMAVAARKSGLSLVATSLRVTPPSCPLIPKVAQAASSGLGGGRRGAPLFCWRPDFCRRQYVLPACAVTASTAPPPSPSSASSSMMAPTTSSTLSTLGIFHDCICCARCLPIDCTSGVSVNCGHTQHTLMLAAWCIHARLRTKCTAPAFVAAYASSPGAGKMPAEEALTRTTPPRARMLDTASAAPSTTAPRLMADMRRQSASPTWLELEA